jgi:protein O-mannosyl-transferase
VKPNVGRSGDWSAKRALGLCGGVFALTLLTYLPALGNGFVNWDDDIYVTANPAVCPPGSNFLRYAFLEFHASNWHPLTWLSHALDCAIWGLNPTGHHLTSIVIHALNAALVVLVSTRILRQANAARETSSVLDAGVDGVWLASATAGLLFGIHPIHVESAAWVAERKDVLSAFFYLSSVLAWTGWAGRASASLGIRTWLDRRLLVSLSMFGLALLAKPMAVTLPAVLLILDWYPFGRLHDRSKRRAALAELGPFLVLAMTAGALSVLAQSGGDAIVSVASTDLQSRFLVAANATVTYLANLVHPIHLLPFYPHPRVVSLDSMRHVLAAAAIMGITALSITVSRRQPWWLASWLAYLVMLSPVLGLVQAGGQSMADRYMYLPSVPPFLLAGVGVPWILGKVRRPGRSALITGGIVAAGLLIMLTVRQIGTWRSSLTLWDHLLEREPTTVPLAYYNRAQAFLENGDIGRAIADYSSAIDLNPRYRDAVFNRGAAHERMGDLARAAADYSAAIQLDPTDARGYNNLGVVQARSGALAEAIDSFSRAIERAPSLTSAIFNRGLAYAQSGQIGLASRDLRRACEQGVEQACTLVPNSLEVEGR